MKDAKDEGRGARKPGKVGRESKGTEGESRKAWKAGRRGRCGTKVERAGREKCESQERRGANRRSLWRFLLREVREGWSKNWNGAVFQNPSARFSRSCSLVC